MEVFRIARKSFSDKLIASGKSSRWNLDDQFVLYTGSSRSLSTLELIVHRNSIKPSFVYKVMVVSIADDDALYTTVLQKDLPKNWRDSTAYPDLQLIGNNWYNSKQSLVLKVPSAIIPMEYNYIINMMHDNFEEKVSLVRTEDHFWDERLL